MQQLQSEVCDKLQKAMLDETWYFAIVDGSGLSVGYPLDCIGDYVFEQPQLGWLTEGLQH